MGSCAGYLTKFIWLWIIYGRSGDALRRRSTWSYRCSHFWGNAERQVIVEGTAPHYLIKVDRPSVLDEVTVHVEMSPQVFSDKMGHMQELRGKIVKEIYTLTGIYMNVNLVQPGALERSSRKINHVIDHRLSIKISCYF